MDMMQFLFFSLVVFLRSDLVLANPPLLSEPFPCAPESSYLEDVEGGPDLGFCSEWNPDFGFRGNTCCMKARPRVKRRTSWCPRSRSGVNYCQEITQEQRDYIGSASTGKLGDVLKLISDEGKHGRSQSFCNVNNGFLVYGRPLISSAENRIKLRSPNRCTNFGTDAMIGMLEWVGRRIATQYSESALKGVHMIIGDISAPKGGCLSGRGGRRGHSSHTSGKDVDIGFLTVKSGGESPVDLHRQFDSQANWWMVKQLFKNPLACIKVIFLDRRLIQKLAKTASGDPEWVQYRSFIRHIKGHRNHWHVRIGDGPGPAGCVIDPHPELETEEEGEAEESPDDSEEFLNSVIQQDAL
jgi:murein endopeptidase